MPRVLSADDPLLPNPTAQRFLGWLRNRATPAIAARRHLYPVRAMAALCDLYLDMVANRCYEHEVNGEQQVLEQLAASRPVCVFDVGANVGDWTLLAARLFPDARIHAFEIVPETAGILRNRTASLPDGAVTVNALGLADQAGTVDVAYLPGFSEGSSAVMVHPSGGEQWRQCEVVAGDDYCAEHGIEHIDLLKLDVEGLEHRVLAGFEAMLSAGRIDVVQFEYGHPNASTRFLLGDFYELFDRHGFDVGQIFPDGVEFRAYNPVYDETFRGPNYLAVHRGRAELRARLATG